MFDVLAKGLKNGDLPHLRKYIERAIDEEDHSLAALIVEILHAKGLNYMRVFELVKVVRPDVELAGWDALLYEEVDTDPGPELILREELRG